MNAFTQALTSQHLHVRQKNRSQIFRVNFFVIVLMLGILFSAFMLVYLKDLNRRLFMEYQQLQLSGQQYETDWGKLLLEQTTWSTQARIQRLAEQRLHMIYPRRKNMVIIGKN